MGSQPDPESEAAAPSPVSEPLPDPDAASAESTTPLGAPPNENGSEGNAPPRESPDIPSASSPPAATSTPGVDLPPLANPASSVTSSWSASSECQLGHHHGSSSAADPQDRVFPIRSVVSVDQSQSSPWASQRNPADSDYFPRTDTTWNGRRRPSNPRLETDPPLRRAETLPNSTITSPTEGPMSRRKNTISGASGVSITSPPAVAEHFTTPGPLPIFNDDASENSDQTRESRSAHAESIPVDESAGRATPSDNNDALMTTRFRHVMTEDGHAVITGRDGNLQRCEDEPIHTPGAVQSFGLLVALKEDAEGRFTVRVVSENSAKIIGYSPQQLFRLNSFTEIFTEEQADNLLDHIDFIRDEETDPATNGPDVFSISIRPHRKKAFKLWCAIHVNHAHPDLVICEFELEDDNQHPLRPPGEMMPDAPEDTLYQNPTHEELNESTEVLSRPLRVLRSARKRRGEAGAMQVFDIMSQVQEQLASAPNLSSFLKILVGIVKELTGFHRVMIYQFDAAYNGKVVTELVDPAQTRDLYHGLHFPASDIPKQARELYKLNKVRLLYDRDLESARLVCRASEDLEQPLDLSHAYLRAMSPIHLKYLGNMAVRSSMSISINAFNELWGLIACHSYGGHGMRVPFPIRKMCRLVGDTASRNIERLSYASRLQARKLINTMPTDKNPSGYIIASSDDLLKLFDADFGMLSIKGETKVLGKVEHSQEALAMLEYLRMRSFTSVLTTQDIQEDFPDLRYTPGFTVIAGLLYVPLSVGGHDFIVFFRKGQVKDVKWAGNPYEKIIREGTSNYLEPRSSFQVWHERVVGKCREWTEEQVETAAVLCLVYGKFIEVWRQKEAALQNSRLTRLLLANSAHEVRTPLNAIINYLEIALEGSLDAETRDNLARSHSASKSLIYVINDLLDLTKTEEGQNLVKDEIIDLHTCLKDATEPFISDAKRKAITYDVIKHPGLPHYVHGDYRRVRQAISNLTANAVQNTPSGSVRVETYVSEVEGSRIKIEVVVQDTGCGMSNEMLDNLFQDLEQVTNDFDESMSVDDVEKPQESRALGLGLAVVARIVRNMAGQLRLKSEEGVGSRFVIQLPFDLPTEEALEKTGASNATLNSDTNSSLVSVTAKLPPSDAREVLLVDRGTAPNAPDRGVSERKSFDETTSVSSLKSATSKVSRASGGSNRSDADRLIDAIQTPLSLGDPDEGSNNNEHRHPKGSRHLSTGSTTSLPEVESRSQPPSASGDPPARPATMQRATTGPPQADQDATAEPQGVHPVKYSKTPIRPVKMPDEYLDQPSAPQPSSSSKVLFEISDRGGQEQKQADKAEVTSEPDHLRVLIAEDDPINMKILTKRLEKIGHLVSPAANGEDCATVYREKPAEIDLILMDMQMPIVDGLTSTKMIRAFERSEGCKGLSFLASANGRVPIFAVSASLVEHERPQYIEAGFDGWILKPIDFKRLNVLLRGIYNDEVRNESLYVSGEWERGGWFVQREPRQQESSLSEDNTATELAPDPTET